MTAVTHAADDERVELRKEGATMALYVAISLLAALTALPEGTREHVPMTALVWGTTAGLALAHVFAFRVTARMVATGRVRARDLAASGVQVGGAVGVALVATAATWLAPDGADDEVLALVLAGVIGAIALLVARFGGADWRRAVLYALAVLVLAVAVVELKNRLTGH